MLANGVEHPTLTTGGQTALDLRPLTRPAAGVRTQADSRRAAPESPFADRVQISPAARSLAQAVGVASENPNGDQHAQDIQVDFLPPIMRSVLVRLSDRFYQAPGIEEQLAQLLESEFALQPSDTTDI